MFQVRFNFRDNMVPWNQYFAHAVGFKVSWDEPPDSFHPYHHLHRRTVYNNLETLLNRYLLWFYLLIKTYYKSKRNLIIRLRGLQRKERVSPLKAAAHQFPWRYGCS